MDPTDHKQEVVLSSSGMLGSSDVVLGGWEAVRSRYGSIDVQERIHALKEAPKHGYQGLQLLHLALQDPDIDVRLTAYRFARLMHPQKQPPCDYRKLFKTIDSWNWDAFDPEVQILKITGNSRREGREGLTWVTQTINQLIERKDQPGFQQLKAIYLGDDLQGERDLYALYKKSYLYMADFATILTAFPELEVLHICGRFGDYDSYFTLSPLHHSRLQSLLIETADQSHELLTALQTAELPELQYLELWLGRNGFVDFKDFAPLFEDLMSGKLFPKLRYLGLRSSEDSHIPLKSFEQLDHNSSVSVLDLSLGIFYASKLKRILENSALHRLDVLDLHNISFNSDKITEFELYQEDASNTSKERLLELIQNHPAHIVYGTTCLDLLEYIDSGVLQEQSRPQTLDDLETLRHAALYE
jgi:hypothetical protein